MNFNSITLLATIIQFSNCVSVKEEKEKEVIRCDGLIFNHVYFDRKVIVSNLGRPYNLVMHKFSGILFFSHTIQTATTVDFGIMACHIEKEKCLEIKGINGGYAIAYDSINDDIFFGGHDGIYKYNFLTKTAEFFAEDGKSIWGIFIRKNFYYIEYPSQKLYVLRDDTFVRVAEATQIEIDHFYMDKMGDVFYSNKTALFKVPRRKHEAIVLSDELLIRQITEDMYGDIYFCAQDGIYYEDKPFHKVKKVADIDQAFGLTFDEKDHVIYSDRDTIYKLVPSKYSAQCMAAIKNVTGKVVVSSNDELRRFKLNLFASNLK